MNENKPMKLILQNFGFIGLLMILTVFLMFVMKASGLAGVSVYDACNGYLSCGGIPTPSIVTNESIEYTQAMIDDYYAKIAPPVKNKPKPVKVAVKIESTQEVAIKPEYDIDKLAYAVAMHETKNCTIGNSASVNNCFGIRQCSGGRCYGFKKYATKEESYKAFKKLWETHYKGLPNYSKAKKYSGNDRADIWLKNVLHFYHS